VPLTLQRRSVTAESVATRQSQTAATGIARAAARIDAREGQRPRLTQISNRADLNEHSKLQFLCQRQTCSGGLSPPKSLPLATKAHAFGNAVRLPY